MEPDWLLIYKATDNENEKRMTIKVGDTVTWGKAHAASKGLDPLGVPGCKVVKLGESEDGEPAALIAVFGGGTCGALLADLHKDKARTDQRPAKVSPGGPSS
jgi:hypothetical protein